MTLLCFLSLTDDVQIFLQVKEGYATGMQTFPRQLQLQFLLQGRFRAWYRGHIKDPHHKAILQEERLLAFHGIKCLRNTTG